MGDERQFWRIGRKERNKTGMNREKERHRLWPGGSGELHFKTQQRKRRKTIGCIMEERQSRRVIVMCSGPG